MQVAKALICSILCIGASGFGRNDAMASVQPGQGYALQVGDIVPTVEGIGLDGKAVRIDYKGRKRTVLYIISPFSAFVVRNEPNFATLVRQRSKEYRFVAVSGRDERLLEYVEKVRPDWKGGDVTIVGGISPELRKAMKIGGYPQTFVIGEDGRVVAAFLGAYTGEKVAAVEHFFRVKLPGLLPEQRK